MVYAAVIDLFGCAVVWVGVGGKRVFRFSIDARSEGGLGWQREASDIGSSDLLR